MKLLITTPIYPPDIGGPATYVSTLVQKVPKTVKTEVISFGEKNKNTKGLSIISIRKSFFTRQFNLLNTLLSKLKEVDWCYVQGTLTVGLTSMLACKLRGKAYVVKYVGDEAWETYQRNGGKLQLEEFLFSKKSFLFTILVWLQKIVLQNAQYVVVPSGSLKKLLRTYYATEAVTIPNAVTVPKIPVKKKPYSIITVGRLVPWKNVDIVIKAFSELVSSSSKPWKLTIIGEGPEGARLKRQCQKLKVTDRVVFKGKCSKKQTLQEITASEFLVLYSSYEGLSHTLLEAMALKTKIIASDIAANKDVLDNGKLGRLVVLDDITALTKAFKEYFPKEVVEKAYRNVSTVYTWEKHCNKLLSLLS